MNCTNVCVRVSGSSRIVFVKKYAVARSADMRDDWLQQQESAYHERATAINWMMCCRRHDCTVTNFTAVQRTKILKQLKLRLIVMRNIHYRSQSIQLDKAKQTQYIVACHNFNYITNSHVPVANSLMNIGLSKGNASITDWAGPNIADMSTNVMAPKWELKLLSMESSRFPAPKKISPKSRLDETRYCREGERCH